MKNVLDGITSRSVECIKEGSPCRRCQPGRLPGRKTRCRIGWIAGYSLDAQTVYFNDHHDVAIVGAQVLRQFRITPELSQEKARFERPVTDQAK